MQLRKLEFGSDLQHIVWLKNMTGFLTELLNAHFFSVSRFGTNQGYFGDDDRPCAAMSEDDAWLDKSSIGGLDRLSRVFRTSRLRLPIDLSDGRAQQISRVPNRKVRSRCGDKQRGG